VTHTFVSHAIDEVDVAMDLCTILEDSHVKCWIAPRDLNPGSNWGDEVERAARACLSYVLVLSIRSNRSGQVLRELQIASEKMIPMFVVRIEDIRPVLAMRIYLSAARSFDAFPPHECESAFRDLARAIRPVVPASTLPSPGSTLERASAESRGYVFISYVRADRPFAARILNVFEQRRYAYWDYGGSERNYDIALYRELEERIENAVAFICVISDHWRDSDWGLAEYIYAREANVPVFVVQASPLTRPMPIIVNLQTRIDMSGDFEGGARILHDELKKKGL
jgi:hypothetical protein